MSLFSVLNVSASGMTAQRMRAEVLTQNLANADTTRTGEGGAYRRKDVIFESEQLAQPFPAVLRQQMASSELTGVRVTDILTDQNPGPKRYMPGHPDADQEGYVEFPKVNVAQEMVDLMGASRGYQANVAAMSAVKDMIHKSLELFK